MKTRSTLHRAGFTLLEIMLALAIFAMVITAIYASWIAILRATKVGSEAAADIQRSRIAIQTLEDALTCARSFAADVNHYSFLGENGPNASLSFVAHLPESFPRAGKFGDFDIRRVTFALEPGADSENQLVLRQNPILMDPDQVPDEMDHPIVLAKGVKEFNMAFWDRTAGEWITEWTQTNQMPLKVQVSLVFAGPQRTSDKGLSVVTREIGIASVMVSESWQRPNVGGGGRRGGAGANPREGQNGQGGQGGQGQRGQRNNQPNPNPYTPGPSGPNPRSFRPQ